MARRPLAVRAALLALAASALLAAPTVAPAAGLDARVGAIVARSPVRARTSVYVWDQASRDVLYARGASQPVAPASTMKLLTGAAAMSRFGPDHQFVTQLGLQGYQDGSTWVGDVWLVGGGDPSLSTAGFSRDNLSGHGTNVAGLIAPLRERGITEVTGRVRVDDSLLDSVRWVPEWRRDFRFTEAGALGALTVNESLLGRYVGSRSAHEPDLQAGAVFRALLAGAHITVSGGVARGIMPTTAEVAGEVESAPLSVLLQHMDQASDNFYAEVLLKDIGADTYGPGQGSTVTGRRAAYAELASLGVDMRPVRWVDGCGLAYSDRVTARTLGQVLGVGAQAPWGEEWIASFARSGTSGTLRKRMTHAPYRGHVYAKTGTLRHVSALAGFSERASTHRYGFVVLTYDAAARPVPYESARSLQDRVAMTLVR